jgi:DNA helicase-2/ATP-dependent DNA helicase PcrA
MEMPRGEMEMLGSAGAMDAASFDPWDVPDDDEGDDSWDWQIEDVAVSTQVDADTNEREKPALSVAAASIKTAAAMSREFEAGNEGESAAEEPRVSPDAFRQGMTVIHPEYGPGKVVALSGSGKNRRATIQFATVGEKKIILAHSAVRPVRR